MNIISKTNTLQFDAYEHLKNLIVTGVLETDTLYSETKMSREVGISRTPFREAVKKLTHEGFLEVVPSKGFKIRKLNEKDLKETIEIRCAIEGYCTHLICDNIKSEKAKKLFETLDKLLIEQEKIVMNDEDNEKLRKFDHAFHLELVSFAGNQEFLNIFQNLMYLIQLITNQSLAIKGRPLATVKEHREFYDNLIAGNESAAYKNIVTHLNMPIKIKIMGNN